MHDFIETINLWSQNWMVFMGYGILESTIVFLMVGSLWLMIKKHVSAQFGYCLFLLVLLKLMIPSQISIPGLVSSFLPQGSIDLSFKIGTGSGWDWLWLNGVADQEPAAVTMIPKPATANQPELLLNIFAVIFSVWIATVVILLIRLAQVSWKTIRLFRQTVSIDTKQLPVNVKHLQTLSGVKKPIRWVTGTWVKSPMAYGLWRPCIAIPSNMFENFTPKQLHWILLHELAHIKRGDGFVSLLQKILQILFFMHPIVWLTNAIVDLLREYVCDDSALYQSQSSRKDCGEGFLSVIEQANGLPSLIPATLGMVNHKTLIRRRLMRILDLKRPIYSNLSSHGIISLMVLMILVLLFGGKAAIAQVGQWMKAEVITANNPSARAVYGMAYDEIRKVIVIHGGASYGKFLNDTWGWNGTTKTWTHISNDGPVRLAFGMAHDPARDVLVLSGGSHTPGVPLNSETWEWDRTSWKLVAKEEFPMIYPTMAFHPDRKTIIRHGGFINSSYTTIPDTMEWDGQQWKPLPDGPSLAEHRMVYDSLSKKMVVFGGIKGSGIISNETWEFDGVIWTKVADVGPEGRNDFGMVFDSDRGVIVIFGGGLTTAEGFSSNHSFSDTWQWDGKVWTQINTEGPTNPHQNLHMNMAYDAKNRQIVLFGGNDSPTSFRPNDTWLFSFQQSGVPFSLWSKY